MARHNGAEENTEYSEMNPVDLANLSKAKHRNETAGTTTISGHIL